MESEELNILWRRAGPPDDTGAIFLGLVSDPFKFGVAVDAFWLALGTSIGVAVLVAIIFCFVRPYNNIVYAPKLRYSDEKHAPPPLGKGFFSWIKPVVKLGEADLADKIGLDALIFLRFTRMCRNILLIMTVIGCGVMIPINVLKSVHYAGTSVFFKMSPQLLYGQFLWAHVFCAWVFDIVIASFLWINYRAVTALRKTYYESAEYQGSLSSRTLMLTDIPETLRSNEGIARIIDELGSIHVVPNCVIGRNAKELPGLVKQHETAVRELETHLAKYLKHPDNLPAARPMCKAQKNDNSIPKGQKVDAIAYYAGRIRELEHAIRDIRKTVDTKHAMPYGFASYDTIQRAHIIAYAARGKHPQGATIKLAPKPKDIIWDNLGLSKGARRKRRIINNIWVAIFTVIWTVPNALIAVFLSNLGNLAQVWPAFRRSFNGHPKTWAAVQGILAPALLSLIYLLLPILFRRLSTRAGDRTKTSRERHVTHKLYAFFVFNNLFVFSFFGTIWTVASSIIQSTQNKENFIQALRETHFGDKLTIALCQVSAWWLIWILQRNLGAAVDLIQLANLFWVWFAKAFMSPTPRQLIEWTAPPVFDYASYYNYFLFYATIAFCFATLQPIILPITAFYFCLDSYLKKYLLMYVFITKHESGGAFWIVIFNRMVFATILANVLLGLVVYERGGWQMACAMIPLLVFMIAFKFVCKRKFDDQIHFAETGKGGERLEEVTASKPHATCRDKTGLRFGHPVLTKKLLTPMVLPQARPILEQIYGGRMADDDEDNTYAGEEDASRAVRMDTMSHNHPGKSSHRQPSPDQLYEVVNTHELDFANFKNRADFGEDHGRGIIYGAATDAYSDRVGTPASSMHHSMDRMSISSTLSSRAASPVLGVLYDPPTYHNGITQGQPMGAERLEPRSFYRPPSASRSGSPLALDRRPLGFDRMPSHASFAPSETFPGLDRTESEARLLGRDSSRERR